MEELQVCLEDVRELSLTPLQQTWMLQHGFISEFIDWFANEFELSRVDVTKNDDGQYRVRPKGKWINTTLWEIYILTTISELRTRNDLRKLSEFEIDMLYAKAKARLHYKLENVSNLEDLKFSDFGTRRRHTKDWQGWVVQACVETFTKGQFVGTSNCEMAMKYGITPIGTIAHEIPSVMAALSDQSPDGLIQSQYKYLKDWAAMWPKFKTLLPDTYGSIQFFRNAPKFIDDWPVREDSMDPSLALAYYGSKKTITPLTLSDGLHFGKVIDLVHLNTIDDSRSLIDLSFGIGTSLTNDFEDLIPGSFKHISLVCKAAKANGRDCIKLSNNPAKAIGSVDMVNYYKDVFGTEGSEKSSPPLV